MDHNKTINNPEVSEGKTEIAEERLEEVSGGIRNYKGSWCPVCNKPTAECTCTTVGCRVP